MFSNTNGLGVLNRRGLSLAILIVTAMLAISLLTTSRVLADTPPVVTPPTDIIVEAESPDGTSATDPAIATFLQGATAVHEGETSFPVTAVNPLEIFPLGATTVIFDATDAAANTGTAQATVTIVDTTEPVLILPEDITVEAASQTGANVDLPEVTATDTVDPAPEVSCDPSSGLFPLGTTLVSCTATDASSNIGNGSFNVTVVDTGAPTITPTVEPPPNAAGWNNTDVTVTFECTDAESGIDTCVGGQTVTAEGANQSVEGTTTDLDGNT